MPKTKPKKQKAWVVAVNMGYGHQRPAHSLHHLAQGGKVIVANAYPGIPNRDKNIWKQSRSFYEFISRFKNIPVVGETVFNWYDQLQSIPTFYPRRDLSNPNLQLSQIYRLVRRKKWGKHLIDTLAKNPVPLVTTFFVTAFMAEEHSYPGDIYCIVTDTDISRAWVPLEPGQSRIKYCAPNYRVMERLVLYGVREENIFLTGFPLPKENIGLEKTMTTLRHDIVQRLVNLDPERRYFDRYGEIIHQYLGVKHLPKKSDHPLTVTFAVGGAAAQREIGAVIIKSLSEAIRKKKIKLVMVAGIHNNVSTFFRNAGRQAKLTNQLGKGLEIIYANSKEAYFDLFNKALRKTDVLWTKPSELSFYCGLGIPIIIAPPIGSQEDFNRRWLRTIGAGDDQFDPHYAGEWLFDWVQSGWLAEAAMEGFVEAPKAGTFNIEKIIAGKSASIKKVEMTLQY